MRADVILHTDLLSVLGEVTDEHPSAPGRLVFLSWQAIGSFKIWQPYELLRVAPARLIPRYSEQVEALEERVRWLDGVELAQLRPWRQRRPRTLSLVVAARQVPQVRRLLRRDGVTQAAWLRSVVLREIHHRARAVGG